MLDEVLPAALMVFGLLAIPASILIGRVKHAKRRVVSAEAASLSMRRAVGLGCMGLALFLDGLALTWLGSYPVGRILTVLAAFLIICCAVGDRFAAAQLRAIRDSHPNAPETDHVA